MDNRRRLELIRQEVRRKRQIARLDAAHRLEHLEVAEALAYAAEIISREDESCKLAIKSSLPPLRLRVKKAARARRTKRRSPGISWGV